MSQDEQPKRKPLRKMSHPDDAARRAAEEAAQAEEDNFKRTYGERDYVPHHDPENAHYEAPTRDQEHDAPEYAHPDSEDYLPRPLLSEEEIVAREELPDDAPPPSTRRQNRIAAMQFLYMTEFNKPDDIAEALYAFFTTREQARDFYAFGEELALGAWENREAVDAAISKFAANWTFDRIARVDLAILRLAVYELLFRRDIPPIVSINEAIDLSKTFSTPDAKRFINGILDKLKETLDRPLRTADV